MQPVGAARRRRRRADRRCNSAARSLGTGGRGSLLLATVCVLAAAANCGDRDPPISLPLGQTVTSTTSSSQASSSTGSQGAGGTIFCDDPRLDSILSLPVDLARGPELYAKSCGLDPCHGPDGVSGNAPDFMDVLPQYDDCEQLQIMLDGIKGMLSLTAVFSSDQDFRDALAYVRETFPY